jgi:hypothetical protein
MRRIALLIGIAMLSVALPFDCADAQIVYGEQTQASASFHFRSWTATADSTADVTLSQWLIPVVGMVPLADNTEMKVTVSYGSLDPGENGTSLSGPTDLKLQLSRSLADEHVLLALATRLPVGKTGLTYDELQTVAEFANPILNNPLVEFGRGVALGLSLGYSWTWGPSTLGLGGGYLYNGGYEYSVDGDKYRPGAEINAVSTGRLPLGEGSLDLGAYYTHYSVDQLAGTDIYQRGDRVQLSTTLTLPMGDNAFELSLCGVNRATPSTLAEGKLVREIANDNGNLFLADVGYRIAVGESHSLRPVLEARYIAESESGFESEQAFGGGLDLVLGMGADTGLQLGARYLTGTAAGNVDLRGLAFRAGIVQGFGGE